MSRRSCVQSRPQFSPGFASLHAAALPDFSLTFLPQHRPRSWPTRVAMLNRPRTRRPRLLTRVPHVLRLLLDPAASFVYSGIARCITWPPPAAAHNCLSPAFLVSSSTCARPSPARKNPPSSFSDSHTTLESSSRLQYPDFPPSWTRLIFLARIGALPGNLTLSHSGHPPTHGRLPTGRSDDCTL